MSKTDDGQLAGIVLIGLEQNFLVLHFRVSVSTASVV